MLVKAQSMQKARTQLLRRVRQIHSHCTPTLQASDKRTATHWAGSHYNCCSFCNRGRIHCESLTSLAPWLIQTCNDNLSISPSRLSPAWPPQVWERHEGCAQCIYLHESCQATGRTGTYKIESQVFENCQATARIGIHEIQSRVFFQIGNSREARKSSVLSDAWRVTCGGVTYERAETSEMCIRLLKSNVIEVLKRKRRCQKWDLRKDKQRVRVVC
jgi:hypothetical protein